MKIENIIPDIDPSPAVVEGLKEAHAGAVQIVKPGAHTEDADVLGGLDVTGITAYTVDAAVDLIFLLPVPPAPAVNVLAVEVSRHGGKEDQKEENRLNSGQHRHVDTEIYKIDDQGLDRRPNGLRG